MIRAGNAAKLLAQRMGGDLAATSFLVLAALGCLRWKELRW